MKNLRSVISLSNQGINFKESIKKDTQTKERESKRERKICNGVTRQLLQSIVIDRLRSNQTRRRLPCIRVCNTYYTFIVEKNLFVKLSIVEKRTFFSI